MRSKHHYIFNLLNTLILSGALMWCANLLSDSIRHKEKSNDLLSQKELLNYLSISEKELNNIIEDDKYEKAKLIGNGSWETYRFLPYAEVGDQKIFIKSEIKKWLQFQSVKEPK
ncbi:hypothetical protein J5Y03_11595 [Bacillus sp. RG28]|uniref:Uncharacterized protein n=1 Tax=Gottfriedia endophytica TaxID=2820819 RepID=A0A940NI51_9BACI|nr:hypothetical protein [Gottfriedia endophytica]MBP0725814.1 hypothetical protein [Gottfriedia endophytica]